MTTTDPTPSAADETAAAPPDPFAPQASPATQAVETDAAAAPGEAYAAWASQWGAEEPEGSLRSWLSLLALVAALVAAGIFWSWAIVVVIIGIVGSIFLHELGHFLVARKTGMKATEFFIGFGPRIWSFRRGETEYGVKMIPAGAYVRIIGMHNLEEVDEADESRTYRSKPYLKRLAVILAGPFMNIALGFLIVAGVFAVNGIPSDRYWDVDAVLPGSTAAVAGIEPGDRIVSVNGTAIEGDPTARLQDALAGQAGKPLEIVVLRDGEQLTLAAPLGWRLNAAAAAALPGAAEDDVIMSVDGAEVTDYEQLQGIMAAATEPVDVELQRNGRVYALTVDPNGGQPALPDNGANGFIGVRRGAEPNEQVSPPMAVVEAAKFTGGLAAGAGVGLVRLFSPSGLTEYAGSVGGTVTGDPTTNAPAGLEDRGPAPGFADSVPLDENRPIGIIGMTSMTSQSLERYGLAPALILFASLNLFLGLLNLLPLLPLDGGHAAVATYEAVRSRKGRPYRVDMAKLLPVTYAVVLVLAVLGLSAMYMDIANPIQLP